VESTPVALPVLLALQRSCGQKRGVGADAVGFMGLLGRSRTHLLIVELRADQTMVCCSMLHDWDLWVRGVCVTRLACVFLQNGISGCVVCVSVSLRVFAACGRGEQPCRSAGSACLSDAGVGGRHGRLFVH
jgi:hypothetical protein